MKKPLLRFWYPIVGLVILDAIRTLIWGLNFSTSAKFLAIDLTDWAAGACLFLLIYIVIRNIIRAIKNLISRRSSGEDEELERQREIERKEVEMVRKSNEILLHLIQDQNREKDQEGDR